MAKKKQKEKSGNAVIYARYSSHNQREASLEQQISECRKYAERNGYKITDIYQDAAVSGRTDDRPAFKRMMADAKKEKFDYIICWKSNRIGRNMTQTMTNMAKLAECGVECLYTEEDFDNTASGRFALRNMMNVNQFYSENMAEDITRGLMDNAQKCMVNCRLPYGYKKGPDGKFAIDEPTAAVVREIYDKFRNGWIIADILADLNNRGIRTRNGNEWKFQSFNKLLQNEQYIGIYKYSGVRIEGGIPQIIDKDTFEEVQKLLTTKKRPRGRRRDAADYILVGKCFCGMCGAPMTGVAGTARNGSVHHYYACNNRRYEHKCDKKNVPKDDLEFSVADAIQECLHDQGLVDWILDSYKEIIRQIKEESKASQLEAELEEVNKNLGNLMKAFEAGLINDVAIKRMNELADTKKDIEQALEMEAMALELYDIDELRKTLYRYRDGDIEDPEFLKTLIKTFVHKILVFDDYLIIQFNYGKEKKVPLRNSTAKLSGADVRENSTNLHQNIISRTTLYADYFEVIAPIRKRRTTAT